MNAAGGSVESRRCTSRTALPGIMRAAQRAIVTVMLSAVVAGCATDPALTYADPTAGYDIAVAPDVRSPDVHPDVANDGTPPTLTILSPHKAAVVQAETVVLVGTATDPVGVAQVRVRVDKGPWLKVVWDEAGQGVWRAWLTVPPGDHTITAEATDWAGNTGQQQLSLHRVRVVELVAREPAKSAAPVTLDLDKAAIKALIPASAAKAVIIYLLDVRPLLVTALAAFKAPTVWGLDTKLWGKAEWNMHRVLTMTPDSADLTGTSAAPLLALASNLGLAPPTLLADIAQIAPTTSFLTTAAVAQGLYANVIASHPALVIDPTDGVKKVPITLYDALADLVTLEQKLGPVGGHPGILYKSTPAAVLLPNFRMTLTGHSNLRQLEGIDLSGGQRWLFLKAPGDDVVVFNFLDPKTFSVTGVADEPQIDLYFQIHEHPGFVNSAYVQQAGADGPYFKGGSAAWQLSKWTFEHMVIDAVYKAFRELHADAGYTYKKTYAIGTIQNAATWTWNRGWLDIKTIAGIGQPPPPTYWWDLVLELAQKRLHDGGIAEGKADLKLPLTGIPVPISAKQLVDKARVLFEQQKSKLSAASVGDHSTYDTPCDVFAVKGAKGEVALLFVTSTDLPGAAKPHPTAGFFEDAALTKKVSTTADAGFGDVSHEKLLMTDGQVRSVYARERDGAVWRLDVERKGDRLKIALWPTAAGGK